MGRHKMLPEHKRSERLWARFTPEEKRTIEAHAARKNRELSEHIREILKKAAKGDFGHGA